MNKTTPLYERPIVANVFDWLDQVELRPGMYLGDGGLEQLETLLWGYYTALGVHNIIEEVPSMGCHFRSWLGWRTGWSMSCGWAYAVAAEIDGREAQLSYFFDRTREFRELRPVVVSSVALEVRHQPTGKRIVIGYGKHQPPPDEIDIVQYVDAPLHSLRFRYPDGVELEDILRVNRPDGSLDIETSLDDAKAWVQAEFRVEPDQWKFSLTSDR